MKKLLLSLIAVSALAFSTQAQTEKGNFMIGGNVQVSSDKQDDADKSNTNFTINPSVGYFIGNNFAIGTGIGYQFSKTHQNTANGGVIATNTLKNEAFIVSPFARYYKGINEQFKFFGQLSVPMAFGNTKVGDADGNNYVKTGKYNSVGVALSPGVAFFPGKKFGIEFSVQGISYNTTNLKDGDGNDIVGGGNKNFNLGANFFDPNIGVQFYF
jgi:hypothetical protein